MLFFFVKLLTNRAGKIEGLTWNAVVKEFALLPLLAVHFVREAVSAEAFGIADRAFEYGQQDPGGL